MRNKEINQFLIGNDYERGSSFICIHTYQRYNFLYCWQDKDRNMKCEQQTPPQLQTNPKTVEAKQETFNSNGATSSNHNAYQHIEYSNINIEGLKISKHEKINKVIIRVQISSLHQTNFDKIKQVLSSYCMVNEIGIYKLSDMIHQTNNLIVQIQSNPLILIKNFSFQNCCQQILRIVAQTMTIFHKQVRNNLRLVEIDIKKSVPLSFCLNPFLGIIKNILKTPQQPQDSSPKINNQLFIQGLVSDLLPSSSKDFYWDYQYFLEKLTDLSQQQDASRLLKLPLFMTPIEKQSQIVYFNNVCSSMAELTGTQHDIRFQNKNKALSKKQCCVQANAFRLDVMMKNKEYRKYSYLYQVGGVVQEQLKVLNICKSRENGRLDWITGHEHLVNKIDLKLKKNVDQSYNHVAYGFSQYLKCLRDSVSHKTQQNHEMINKYIVEYPRLINYLYQNKQPLKKTLEDTLQSKNDWFQEYFDLDKEDLGKMRQIIDGTFKTFFKLSEYAQEAINILRKHLFQTYPKVKESVMKSNEIKCKKCKMLIESIRKSNDFLTFLIDASDLIREQNQAKGKNDYLSAEHNTSSCFLEEQFKSRLIIEVFQSFEVGPKHFMIKNWWFYLETVFPCLIKSFKKIRHLLEA